MRHKEGYWNNTWSDMYVKRTLICHGKGPGGKVAVTLKPGDVKKWANSLH